MKELSLIIKDVSGNIVGMAMENEKGYKKSIEQNELWCLHPETRKLIPYAEFGPKGGLFGISKKASWYEAVLSGVKGGSPDVDAEPAADEDQPVSENAISEKDAGTETVLSTLAALIKERHAKMPEGSYTTHLFSSGEEKIRKKLGEEAVELLLAKNEPEIIYEAADLVYHMLVFLEEKNIPLSAILNELSSRGK